MSHPVQITFHGVDSSEALRAYIEKREEKLATFFHRITSTHVAIECPHKHKSGAGRFRVRIELVVPGGEIVVDRDPAAHPDEDTYAAIDAAFDVARRRLRDHADAHSSTSDRTRIAP